MTEADPVKAANARRPEWSDVAASMARQETARALRRLADELDVIVVNINALAAVAGVASTALRELRESQEEA